MKRALPIVILAFIAYLVYSFRANQPPVPRNSQPRTDASSHAESDLAGAFRNRRSNVQVRGYGVVMKVLKDDLEGGKHQRFILKMDSGQTLLVAHNIDLARRIPNLRVGDNVSFNGEYEWNKRGGVLHWTHVDPSNRHPHGWLKHNDKTYE